MELTVEQKRAALEVVAAVGDAIRDLTLANENGLHGVPSGHLYAMFSSRMSQRQYERGHLLTWIGPVTK